MFMKTLIISILTIKFLRCDRCETFEKLTKYESKDANFTLVAIIPRRLRTNNRFYHNAIAWREATRFAVNEANELLKNHSVNLKMDVLIYETCWNRDINMLAALDIVLGNEKRINDSCKCHAHDPTKKILGIIGPALSDDSVTVAPIMASSTIPMVGFSATSVRLNNRNNFPNYLRTIPPDNHQAEAIGNLILHNGWTYVSLVVVDGEYGIMGKRILTEIFKQANICTDVSGVINPYRPNPGMDSIIKRLKSSKSRIVVLWLYPYLADQYFKRAKELQLFNKTFIVTDGIGKDSTILTADPRVVSGTIMVLPYAGKYKQFEEYLWNYLLKERYTDVWVNDFFESMNGRHGNDTELTFKLLRSKFNLNYVPFIRDAVFAYAFALLNYSYYVEVEGFANPTIRDFDKEVFFHEFLKQVQYQNVHGQWKTFEDGNIENPIYQLRRIEQDDNKQLYIEDIGLWSPPRSKTSIQYKTNQRVLLKAPAKPKVQSKCSEDCRPGYYAIYNARVQCCWKCVECPDDTIKSEVGNHKCTPCPSGMIAANLTHCLKVHDKSITPHTRIGVLIVTLSAIGAVLPLTAIIVFILKRNTPIVRSSHFTLSLIQLSAQFALYLITILFTSRLDAFICVVRILFIGGLLTLILGITLVKTELLLRIFKLKVKINSRRLIINRSVVVVTILFLLTINFGWITLMYLLHPHYLEVKQVIKGREKYTYCNNLPLRNIQVGFGLFIVSICGIQAFRARHLPQHYNEARVIAYASFFNFLVISSWFPLHNSMPDEAKKALVTALIVLAVNSVIFAMMYGYKIEVILFKPHLNKLALFREVQFADVSNYVGSKVRSMSHAELE